MTQLLTTLAIAGVGCLVAVQAAMNARLGSALGVPIDGALWNFALGGAVLAGLVASGLFDRPTIPDFSAAPWWAYFGGLLGATFLTTAIIAVPRVGTATTFGAIVCGQFLFALAIDTFGWLGVAPVPLSSSRVLGIGLLIGVIGGVLLIQR